MTSPFFILRPEHNPQRLYDDHAIKSFAIAHFRNIARNVTLPIPRQQFLG